MERPFFPTEIEARRELSRVDLTNKNHYHHQMIQFDVLDDPRWQAYLEEKQGCFRLDCNRPFFFQHGCMVYNPRDHNWIPNATDNPWANCPGKDSEHEYYVIHTIGRSLQFTNINLTFDVASEHMYYGKVRIKCDKERGYCLLNHAIKATVIWEPENHVFLMLQDPMHLYDESALPRFEVFTTPIYKCNEDRPYYATQYQDILIQYKKGFNFVYGKPSSDFDNTQFRMDHPL